MPADLIQEEEEKETRGPDFIKPVIHQVACTIFWPTFCSFVPRLTEVNV
jgi:hypothetical protein